VLALCRLHCLHLFLEQSAGAAAHLLLMTGCPVAPEDCTSCPRWQPGTKDSLSTGQPVNWTACQLDSLPSGHVGKGREAAGKWQRCAHADASEARPRGEFVMSSRGFVALVGDDVRDLASSSDKHAGPYATHAKHVQLLASVISSQAAQTGVMRNASKEECANEQILSSSLSMNRTCLLPCL